jgi:glucose/arabinose dehydrogenase
MWVLVLLGAACGDSSNPDVNDTGTASSPGTADDDGGPTASGSPTTNGMTTPTSGVETSMGPGDPTMADGTVSTDGGGSSTSDDGNSDDGVAPPCPYEPVEGEPEFLFEVVGYGFPSLPVQVVGDPTTPDRLFVPTQFGQIYVLEPGEAEAPAEPILDIGSDVRVFNEGALCSMVFHPDYPSDPRIFVYYAAQPDGRSRIEEFVIDPDTLAPIDPDSGTTLLELHNDTGSHYGGMMHFDDDDWLMVSIGDGADSVSPGDPMALHSKFIRIGVDPDGTPDNPIACAGCPQFGPFDYTIPPDNPMVNDPGAAPEVWAMGFRNPWRWYFDRDTGDIFAGDVGLESWEEMSLVRPGNHYGWSNLEGNHCAEQGNCDLSAGPNEMNSDGFIAPLVDYPHDPGCAVIAGPKYESCEVPAWNGIIFYGDLCSSGISALRWENEQLNDLGLVFPQNIGPRGSGTNAWGDVFFTGGLFAGEIYRLRPAR